VDSVLCVSREDVSCGIRRSSNCDVVGSINDDPHLISCSSLVGVYAQVAASDGATSPAENFDPTVIRPVSSGEVNDREPLDSAVIGIEEQPT